MFGHSKQKIMCVTLEGRISLRKHDDGPEESTLDLNLGKYNTALSDLRAFQISALFTKPSQTQKSPNRVQ